MCQSSLVGAMNLFSRLGDTSVLGLSSGSSRHFELCGKTEVDRASFVMPLYGRTLFFPKPEGVSTSLNLSHDKITSVSGTSLLGAMAGRNGLAIAGHLPFPFASVLVEA